MFLYIKTNILRGYGIFENDFAPSREPATPHLSGHGQSPLVEGPRRDAPAEVGVGVVLGRGRQRGGAGAAGWDTVKYF